MKKTKLFHKLSFGTRWNLRDIMRHKSRTAMSLIGTVGCTIIFILRIWYERYYGRIFLDMYYSGATNYSSRIYLAEDATDEARQDIANKYNGDWSGTVSVELGEKAISLDVYNVTHGRVRFPNEKNASIKSLKMTAHTYVCEQQKGKQLKRLEIPLQ